MHWKTLIIFFSFIMLILIGLAVYYYYSNNLPFEKIVPGAKVGSSDYYFDLRFNNNDSYDIYLKSYANQLEYQLYHYLALTTQARQNQDYRVQYYAFPKAGGLMLILKLASTGSEKGASYQVLKVENANVQVLAENKDLFACHDPQISNTEIVFRHFLPKCSDFGLDLGKNYQEVKVAY